MSDATLYYGFKMLHVGALILWLGPSLGAWWLLRGLRKIYSDYHEVVVLSHKLFVSVLIIEHLAFAVLLISGVVLAITFHFFSHPWLQWKLIIIGLLILPLEILDVYWGNIKLSRVLKSGGLNKESSSYTSVLSMYHTWLTNSAIIIMPVSVITIFYLVIAKPHLPAL